MKAIILSLMFLGINPQEAQAQPIVATMPKELLVPTARKFKKSRGKGKGKAPHFAKFF